MGIAKRAISVSLLYIGEFLFNLGDTLVNIGALLQQEDADKAGA